ncbi:hypothetical protein ABPG72_022567 [Tetrahymena utriculariae]
MGKDKYNTFFEGKEFINEEKSEEEIRKYMLEDNLGELKRVKKILKQGDDIQKCALYSNLKSYFTWKHEDSIPIIEALINDLFNQAPETQIEAAKCLKIVIAERDLVHLVGSQYVDTIFDTMMQMLRSKQVPIIDEWIQVFENFLIHMNYQKYEKNINDEFVKLSGITSPSINKATSMRILGILMKVKKGHVRDQMIEIAQLFSQTAESEIKQRLLNYVIESIFMYLPKEELEKYWNEKLLEFLQDQNVQIKCDTIEIVSRILDKLSENFKSNKIKILFFDLINTKQNQVKLTFSRYIGPYIFNLRNILDQKPANQTAIFATLQEYCESTENQIRINFLYNLPGLLQVYGKKIWSNVSKQYYNMLLRDEDINVRVQAINIYCQIIEFVGKAEFRNQIKQHMKTIINDEASQPKNQFVKILPQIFEYYKEDVKANRQFFSEILKEFLDILEKEISSPNWRFLQLVINFIEQDFRLYDSFEMNDLYFPIIFQAMLKGSTQIRKTSLQSIINYLEYSSNKQDRDAVISYISNNFYLARSYQQKISYVQFVEKLLEKFDQSLFRNYKFINILNYHMDRVPQLRKYLAKILFPIFQAITSPTEKDQFNKLLEACKNLLIDKDLKVQELTQKACEDIVQEDPNFMEKLNSYVIPVTNINYEPCKSSNQISEDLDVLEQTNLKNRKFSEKPNALSNKVSLIANTQNRKNFQSGSSLSGVTSTTVRNNSGQRQIQSTTNQKSITNSKSNNSSITNIPQISNGMAPKKIIPVNSSSTSNGVKKLTVSNGLPLKSDKPTNGNNSASTIKPTIGSQSQSNGISKLGNTKVNSQNVQSFSNIGKPTSVKPINSLLKK